MSNLILGKFALENLYYSTLAIRHVVLSFIEGMDSRHFHRKNVGDHSTIHRGNLSGMYTLKKRVLGMSSSNRFADTSNRYRPRQGGGLTDAYPLLTPSVRRLYNEAASPQNRHRPRRPRRRWQSGCSGRTPSRASVHSWGAGTCH